MIVQRPATLLDGTPATRVVDEIPSDAVASDFLPDIAARWSILTEPLALLGEQALANAGFADVLEEAIPWHADFVTAIARELSLSRGCGHCWITFPALVLVGDPGVGKSHAVRLLANLAGLGYAALDLGGSNDNRTLAGTSRGYTAATPAWPLVTIASLKTANPLLLLDEVDKAGGSPQNGYPHHTLLAMTEPSTARAWYDSCLMVPTDLGAVSWLFCANDLSTIPKTLRSRLEVVEMRRPAARWASELVGKIAADLVLEMGLPPPAAIHLLDRHLMSTAVNLHAGGATMRGIRRLLRAALADRVGNIRRRLDH